MHYTFISNCAQRCTILQILQNIVHKGIIIVNFEKSSLVIHQLQTKITAKRLVWDPPGRGSFPPPSPINGGPTRFLGLKPLNQQNALLWETPLKIGCGELGEFGGAS